MAVAVAELHSIELRPAGPRGLLVGVTDSSGRTGWGECSPLPGRSPDDLESCRRALDSGASMDDLEGLPAARFALDCAHHDLEAQARSVSVAELLADRPAPSVPTSQVVMLDDDTEPPPCAAWKVKVGSGDFEDELAALIRLRKRAPAGRMRIDVNRQWPRQRVAEYLERLVPLDLEWVEEPTSAEHLLELGSSPVPIAVDESTTDHPGCARLAIERGLARFVVIKPMLLGSFAEALAWAEYARHWQAAVVVSHLFDGPVALAAYAELAVALWQRGDPAPGLGWHRGLGAYPDVSVPQLAGDRLRSAGPGLGVAP